jgi:snRNA-activating protein complex subunit 3
MSSGAVPNRTADYSEALVTITIYNRVTWSHGLLSRASQHVLLASQTLGDLFDVIPCSSNELLEEIIEDDRVVGYSDSSKSCSSGFAICIENVVYGDGQSEVDYAE